MSGSGFHLAQSLSDARARGPHLPATACRARIRPHPPAPAPALRVCLLHPVRANGHATARMQPILRSPEVNGNRSRCDFTIGFDAAGLPVAGHLMGLFRDGVTYLAPPEELPMPSATAKAFAALMTRFLNSDRSSLPPWDKGCSKDVPVRTPRRRLRG